MGKEKYIAVMGVTGAGKSSFIKLVTGDDSIKVGNTLVSETEQLGSYKFRHKDRTIVLVDTPGFDDTTKKDADVLKLLAEWLESMYKAGTKLSGIIYLHRISDDRMRGSSMRSMRMFRNLCGESFYRNLLLGTTCWSLVSEDVGARREKELMTDQNFWKGLIAQGAQFVRIPDDGWDAKELVYDLARMEPASLQIQEEMVDKHINFNHLSAAQTLEDDAKALREAQEKEKRRLEDEHRRKVAEQNRKLQQQRMQLERENQVKLRTFQLDTEHDIVAEAIQKFTNGLTNQTYLANLYPLTNSLGMTCDGCCRWLGNDPFYTCSTCHQGRFKLCNDCYKSTTVFCHDLSHHSSMVMIQARDGPPECRHVKYRIPPEAVLPCYRCSKNITGIFSHCCVCLDDNFNMCLECLTANGTCKKSWSVSGHKLHAILRRQRYQPPLDLPPSAPSSPVVNENNNRRPFSSPPQHTYVATDKPGSFVKVVPSINVRDITLSHTLSGSTKAIQAVEFSPSNNTLASGGEDSTIRLWDSDTGTLLRALTGHRSQFTIEDLAFGPDGNMLASVSNDSTAQLWDLRSNTSIQSFAAESMAFGVAISPDGTKVAAGLSGKVKVWDTRSMTLVQTLEGHKSLVTSVCFSPDGTLLASTGNDKTVRIWDAQSGSLVHNISASSGMMKYIMAVLFSPDGKTLASGGFDSTVKLWNSQTGGHIRNLKSKTSGYVNDLAFSPDGKVIATGQLFGQVEFWNAEEGFVLHNIKAHEAAINAVSWSTDGRLLATGSEDKTVKLWRF